MLKTLLKSKKFLVSLSGVLFVLLNQISGLEVPEATVLQVVGLMAAYVVGQGFADKGKEEAKVHTEADAKLMEKLDGE